MLSDSAQMLTKEEDEEEKGRPQENRPHVLHPL